VADYSQIELRAAAAIAGETKMIEAYRRGEAPSLRRRTARSRIATAARSSPHRNIAPRPRRHCPKSSFARVKCVEFHRVKSRTGIDKKPAQDRAISTFSTSPFRASVRRMNGREVSVYQALERAKARAEGEDGRAKSGRLKKRPLILFE